MAQSGISNFHTHTSLCKHAEGFVSDYISVAETAGCSALGFSDHCPYPNDGRDTWSGVRMDISQAESYRAQVRSAAAGVSFPVYCGFECEYDKRYREWYKDLKESLSLDYLVFGPHWVDVDGEFVYAPQLEDTREIHRYFDGVAEGISTGLFNLVAHPDLIMANGRSWSKDLEACFCTVIDAAIAAGIPLEINGEGLSRPLVPSQDGMRHPYPVLQFWELAGDKGAKVICNADAHRPCNVIANAALAREYAKSLGIVPLETIF